jgi:uncharacterized protein YndB with AHSA1/START domain
MTDTGSSELRIDRASRVIAAPSRAVYAAFISPDALVSWLSPQGMTARLDHFDPRVGGSYRVVLTYTSDEKSAAGKSSQNTDVVDSRFVELVPDVRVVQLVDFLSDDPAFSGTMRMTWALEEVAGGTRVMISCENVPPGISIEDHETGLKSTLDNLATYLR